MKKKKKPIMETTDGVYFRNGDERFPDGTAYLPDLNYIADIYGSHDIPESFYKDFVEKHKMRKETERVMELGITKDKTMKAAHDGRNRMIDEETKKRYAEWQRRADIIWNNHKSFRKMDVAIQMLKDYKTERRSIENSNKLDTEDKKYKIDDLDLYFKKADKNTIRKQIVKPSMKPTR